MTLATFYADVVAELGRGPGVAARVPRWARLAAEWMEQNTTFNYMRKQGEAPMDADAEVPWRFAFPSDKVKAFELVRVAQTDDAGHRYYGPPLKQVDPREVTAVSCGYPSGYWLDGTDYVCLDAFPGTDYVLDLSYFEYTDWPTDTSATPKLLAVGEGALFAATMLQAAGGLRDDALKALWSDPNDMMAFPAKLQVLVRADDDLRQTGRDYGLNYVPSYAR